jgi:Family of unknown function (DUF6498)
VELERFSYRRALLGQLLGGTARFPGPGASRANPTQLTDAFTGMGFWAIAAVAGCHVVYFIYDFLYRGEFRRTSAAQVMMAPYGRIVVLHIAILAGAFTIMLLGSPVVLLNLLIVGKAVLELGLQRASGAKREAAGRGV